jgi:acetylornithine deacetylase/succinyl-diaminopimelate desuccinylase-like protein
LCEYVRVPALSPNFDANWESTGHLRRALALIVAWCEARPITGLTLTVEELPGRTPLVLMVVEPSPGVQDDTTVLMYGHLDKQPEMTGWRADLGPWTPVIEDGRLYGRGGADDGYAAFAALSAIEACQRHGGKHGRIVVLIEASEESGSVDLPDHLAALGDRLGDVSLVICLDSGCEDYERLWTTTSLRGIVQATLTVSVLTEGRHSGMASGIVPSSVRILRLLLERVEDAATGRVLVETMHVEIPPHRIEGARTQAILTGGPHLPTHGATRTVSDDPLELILNSAWRPALSYIAAGGFPKIGEGGNVLRPSSSLTLSFRLPPGADPDRAIAELTQKLTTDVPYDATVTLDHLEGAWGWDAPATAPWLQRALDQASETFFAKPSATLGEGGSIPFMAMLGTRFPAAQFVVTGALGPDSNAHGPNEYLHLVTAQKVSASMAVVLDAHARR